MRIEVSQREEEYMCWEAAVTEVELEVEAECRVWQVRRRNGGHCVYDTC